MKFNLVKSLRKDDGLGAFFTAEGGLTEGGLTDSNTVYHFLYIN